MAAAAAAAVTLNLSTILSLTILTLLLALATQITAVDPEPVFEDIEDDEVYVIDNPLVPSFRPRSRFLAGTSTVKKGAHCDPAASKSICNGVSANNGSGLLYCCKTHCRNVLSDRNNCGGCGNKCSYGELCCQGSCTNVFYSVNNCGKCNKRCPSGVKCEYGTCGYA